MRTIGFAQIRATASAPDLANMRSATKSGRGTCFRVNSILNPDGVDALSSFRSEPFGKSGFGRSGLLRRRLQQRVVPSPAVPCRAPMSARWPKLGERGIPAAGVVLVDFYQASCAPCRALEPRLEAFARRHAGELRVLQVDVDEDSETPHRFGVQSLPTLLVFRDGKQSDRLDGLITDDDLEAALGGG